MSLSIVTRKPFVLVLLFLLSLTVSITCSSDQVYINTFKKCTMFAYEEFFTIFNDQTVVAESIDFPNQQTTEKDYCLPATTNNQYRLLLHDVYNDGWYAGAWLEIRGIYDNVVFKGTLDSNMDENYTLSLYMPIMKGASWKMTQSEPTSEWTSYSFSDSTWNDVTLGSLTGITEGTQYYRKAISGISDLAAYEARFQYTQGIIVYVNGLEILRDNMPEGAVTSTTSATGSYTTLSFRGVLRPAYEVTSAQTVVAVELHFTQDSVVFTDFDAWLSIYGSSVVNEKCMIAEHGVTISGITSSDPAFTFDYSLTTYIQTSNLPFDLFYVYPSTFSPLLNAVRINPGPIALYSPINFSLGGSTSVTTSGTYEDILSVENAEYNVNIYSLFTTFSASTLYKSYRFRVTSSGLYLRAYEIWPLVCNTALPPSIEFEQSEYTFYKNYQQVLITPLVKDFKDCTLSPELPQGLVLDNAKCKITGIATEDVNGVLYTMTSAVGNTTGTFTLTITTCTGTMVEVVRSYQNNPFKDTFSIVDAVTQQVIYAVAASTSQEANTMWSTSICIVNPQISVDVDSDSREWAGASYIYLNAYLSTTEKEPLMRNRFDNYINTPTSTILSTLYTIPTNQQWSYKMGEVPENWYDTNMASWTTTGTAGTFPESSNQIQLYKKQFTVSSLNNLGAISISLRYRFGCIIYLNGHEVFRNAVTGPLSTQSLATGGYMDYSFHTITLPLKTFAIDSTPSVSYIQQGTNTIAIALVASTASIKTAEFDCALRFLGHSFSSRVLAYEAFSTSYTTKEYAFDLQSSHRISSSTCFDNYYGLKFDNDRREWISSVIVQNDYSSTPLNPHQFLFQARNKDSEEWVTLVNATNIQWSMSNQQIRIWVRNNQPYNQYQFANIGTGISTSCSWSLSHLEVFADDMLQTVPELTYPQENTVFKDIEMAEIYPSSNKYYNFRIQPALPTGIVLNPHTGIISGTASVQAPSQTYTITATRCTGGDVTVPLPLHVDVCTNGKSLITVTIQTDMYMNENSYKIFTGRGTTGSVVSSINEFPVKSGLYYIDNCLVDNLYTFQGTDSYGDGWTVPSGYMLSVDVGQLRFNLNMVPSGVKPVSSTTVFSSYLPFQVDYTDWKVHKTTDTVASTWNTLSFDDSTWETMKATEIGTSEAITVYLRKSFSIPNLDDYVVLNVRVKYTGGVVAYFNGNKVARFNLADSFNANSESLVVHDSNLSSKFHIPLAIKGAVAGQNVIAFEVHRPTGLSSAIPVVFDTTGVFGVEECSPVLDTYTVTNSTDTMEGYIENLFDLNPSTTCKLPTSVGTYIQWTVDNLEGSIFNSYGFFVTAEVSSWGFTLYGRTYFLDDWTALSEVNNGNAKSRILFTNTSPVGIASFKEFRWENDKIPSGQPNFDALVFSYCKPSGDVVCAGEGEYPAVGEGDISPGPCPAGFRGYSYRKCTGGVLSEVFTEKCLHKLPENLQYHDSYFTFVIDTNIQIPPPSYDNIIEEFYVEGKESLPEGLVLDPTTGAISGKPTSELLRKEITIYGKNKVGVTTTTISIACRKGECKSEGYFPKVQVGEVAVHECSSQGSLIGKQTRACILGEKDGEWQKVSGMCVSVVTITVVCIIVLFVIIIIVFILIRSRKAKAVGGVKGKKAIPKKSPAKKENQKSVKV